MLAWGHKAGETGRGLMPQRELCKAIEERRRIEFEYRGSRYSVDPYVVYEESATGNILLGGFQGRPTRGWRTYDVAQIIDIDIKVQFVPIVFDSRAPKYDKAICLLKV